MVTGRGQARHRSSEKARSNELLDDGTGMKVLKSVVAIDADDRHVIELEEGVGHRSALIVELRLTQMAPGLEVFWV
jgi:hypothetical protein